MFGMVTLAFVAAHAIAGASPRTPCHHCFL